MANPPPPYDDITGISRAVMKDNAQVTIENYNGNARPGELVVDQLTDQVFIGNSSGALTQIAAGIGNGGVSGLPAPLKKELSIRVYGVDTPEKGFRAQCPSEAQRGEAASAFTKQLITNSQQRQVVLMDWDKYGGRVLGDVILNGVSLRQQLIANGFAREYYGEAKTSWCQ